MNSLIQNKTELHMTKQTQEIFINQAQYHCSQTAPSTQTRMLRMAVGSLYCPTVPSGTGLLIYPEIKPIL